MSGSCWGSDEAEDAVEPPAESTPEVGECTSGCPCTAFVRYNDPFATDYDITNCAGLSARLRNKWGNLRVGQTGSFSTDAGKIISSVFTVDGLRDAARAAGALTDRGTDYTSAATSNPCDILFVLWVLRSGQYGAQLADKDGLVIQTFDPNTGEDFHIVAGRLGPRGEVPAQVYSTNGQRPREGPAPIADWTMTTGTPSTTQPAFQEVFWETSTIVPGSNPYRSTDLPPRAITTDESTTFDPAKFYYRIEMYNNNTTPEVFIIDDDFMRTFTSSS